MNHLSEYQKWENRDVLFEYHLKFWNTASISIQVIGHIKKYFHRDDLVLWYLLINDSTFMIHNYCKSYFVWTDHDIVYFIVYGINKFQVFFSIFRVAKHLSLTPVAVMGSKKLSPAPGSCFDFDNNNVDENLSLNKGLIIFLNFNNIIIIHYILIHERGQSEEQVFFGAL